MSPSRVFSEVRLVNGSTGDPVLYIDYPDRDNALLFDGGDNAALPFEKLQDLEAVFITHHHVDHFIGLDRIIRANIDADKTLSIYGPAGTIAKVYDRIKSYEYQYFPFQQIVLQVHDLEPDRIRWALLECRRRFPQPEIQEKERSGEPIFGNDEVCVEAAHVDHTVPCVAYALTETPGYHFDVRQTDKGVLRPGPWVAEVVSHLNSGSAGDTPIDIQGGRFRLGQLAQQYFRKSRGARVAYVADTAWSEQSQPALLKLAHKAELLYCDSFYSEKHARQADKYRHMTATRAAAFAQQAQVERLVLIHFSKRYVGRYDALVEEARAIFPNVSAQID